MHGGWGLDELADVSAVWEGDEKVGELEGGWESGYVVCRRWLYVWEAGLVGVG